MNKNLQPFKVFIKPKLQQKEANRRIIGYTRVSSKMKVTNNSSLKKQKKDLIEFAQKHNYTLIKIIGGKYKNDKGDFTRKEFTFLLEKVKQSKNKPFAIAIKFINRFSRSGGSAISIVDQLVDKLGVHLIETSTGLCTSNEDDRIVIYKKLIEAKEENHQRLKRTLFGMKVFLKNGNWLGMAPFGYTMYGKKVKNQTLIRPSQEIVVNKEGKVLKEAWKWKLQGERDCSIIQKMADLGVSITKQKLNSIWRNPFYAGIIINTLLEEPVKGNWEPMVSLDDFKKLNNIISH